MLVTTEHLEAVPARLKDLSYSSLLEFHSCPRRNQLNRMRVNQTRINSVTFSFGHVVGLGMQLSMQGKDWETILFQCFLMWQVDLLAEEARAKKSFFTAIQAVEIFHRQKNSMQLSDGTKLSDYDLAYFNDIPAVELSFRIDIIAGFAYRGFVDAILIHKVTGEYLVLEIKTTGSKEIDEATYKNSAQALGYSIILDAVAKTTGHSSSYRVLYIVYKSSISEFELLTFDKSFTKRADWIRDIIMDVNLIGYYNSQGVFPSRGESCYSFFRQCQHFNLCQMSDKVLIDPVAIALEDAAKIKVDYQINITMLDLINTQLGE